jgi:hypothetical protein
LLVAIANTVRFPYEDETVSELERAIAHAAGVEPAKGDT